MEYLNDFFNNPRFFDSSSLAKSIREMEKKLDLHDPFKFGEGVKDTVISHGLRPVLKIFGNKDCSDLAYNPAFSEYLVVIPRQYILRYDRLGKERHPRYPLESTTFTKVTWAEGIHHFICWSPDSHEIYICRKDFVFVYKIWNDVPLVKLFVDDITKEIIAVGKNMLQKYLYHPHKNKLERMSRASLYLRDSSEALIDLCELEHGPSGVQKVYATFHTNIYTIDFDEGGVVDIRKDMHINYISSILLHTEAMWVITGDVRGTVKCWDRGWNMLMVVIGHQGSITHLVLHPAICGFISAGRDLYMQCWSCALRDKVEKLPVHSQVKLLILNKWEKRIVTLTDRVDIWHMYHLYEPHCTLSAPAEILFTACNPSYPCRTVVASTDSVVRIISPATGQQLTVQIPAKGEKLQRVTYSSALELLYTAWARNYIQVCYASENPVAMWKVWFFRDRKEPRVTSIAVFEYVRQDNIRSAKLKEGESIWSSFSTEVVFLFIGREDGSIHYAHVTEGLLEHSTIAHRGAVNHLLANSSRHKLVSGGEDNVIKVWRVLPRQAGECLFLLVSLYYSATFPVAHIAMVGDVLSLAVSGDNTITHSVIMFNTRDRRRYDHPPSRDHSMKITGITANSLLNLCASSSLDGTVRVWSDTNQLVKEIDMYRLRDSDIDDIKEGRLKAMKKIVSHRYIGSRAWRNLIESILNPPISQKMQLPCRNIQELRDRLENKIRVLDMHVQFKGVHGRTSSEIGRIEDLPYDRLNPIKPLKQGFYPNSVLYKFLERLSHVIREEIEVTREPWTPPVLRTVSQPTGKAASQYLPKKTNPVLPRLVGKKSHKKIVSAASEPTNIQPPEGAAPPQKMKKKRVKRTRSNRIEVPAREAEPELTQHTEARKEDVKDVPIKPVVSRRRVRLEGVESPLPTGKTKEPIEDRLDVCDVVTQRLTEALEAIHGGDWYGKTRSSRPKAYTRLRKFLGDELVATLPDEFQSSESERKSSATSLDLTDKSPVSGDSLKLEKKSTVSGTSLVFKDKSNVSCMSSESKGKSGSLSAVSASKDKLTVSGTSSELKEKSTVSSKSSESTGKWTISSKSSESIAKWTTSSKSSESKGKWTTSSKSSEAEDLLKVFEDELTADKKDELDLCAENVMKMEETVVISRDRRTIQKQQGVSWADIELASQSNRLETFKHSIPKSKPKKITVLKADSRILVKRLITLLEEHGIYSWEGKEQDEESSDFASFVEKLTRDAVKSNQNMLQAIKSLYQELGSEAFHIRDALVGSLKTFVQEPETFGNVLHLLQMLRIKDIDVVTSALAAYMTSGKKIRSLVITFLEECGLHDRHKTLKTYLDSWYKELKSEHSLKKKLDFNTLCEHIEKWNVHWINTLHFHVDQLVREVQSGEVTAHVDPRTMEQFDNLLHEEAPVHTHGVSKVCRRRHNSVFVTISKAASRMLSKSATMDTIKEEDETKLQEPETRPDVVPRQIVEVDLERNITSITDVRLAPEPRASVCMRAHAPWTTSIHKPLKPVFLNAFDETPNYPRPVLLTLRTSRKYFYPETSHR